MKGEWNEKRARENERGIGDDRLKEEKLLSRDFSLNDRPMDCDIRPVTISTQPHFQTRENDFFGTSHKVHIL